MKIKILSMWIAHRKWIEPQPKWINKFMIQMGRFSSISWELLPSVELLSSDKQLKWFNDLASRKTGLCVRKVTGQTAADLRPAYGVLFDDLYEGYDWWGWCDLDLVLGDLDSLLPPLLADSDVLSVKSDYLSGCFALFRNCPETVNAFRLSPRWEEIAQSKKHYAWDESGLPQMGGDSFYKYLVESRLRIRSVPDLYSYSSAGYRQKVRMVGNKLFRVGSNKELLLHHFMDDEWPDLMDRSR